LMELYDIDPISGTNSRRQIVNYLCIEVFNGKYNPDEYCGKRYSSNNKPSSSSISGNLHTNTVDSKAVAAPRYVI